MIQGGFAIAPHNLSKWFFSVVLVSVALVICLALIENSGDTLRLWARYTARISFCYFILSYTGKFNVGIVEMVFTVAIWLVIIVRLIHFFRSKKVEAQSSL